MAITITRTAWTDDDGSGTTGTVINNAVKTELYNQIDAALASLSSGVNTIVTVGTITTGVWNAGALTSSSTLVVTTTSNFGGLITLRRGGVSGTVLGYPMIAHRDITGGGVDDSSVYWADGATANIYLMANGSTANYFKFGSGVVTISALASGNLTSASGVITSSSDERMKDISGSLDYGLAEVLALRPIRYHWNAASGIPTEPEYGGFGAAQVEASMSLAVSYGKDGMRSLNDRVILCGVVNGMRELDARLRALEEN